VTPRRARACACAASSTLRTLTRTRSRLSGFSKKSLAPSLMACTASFTVAWPLMTMMGSVARRLVAADLRSSASRPLMSGSLTSRIARSTGVSGLARMAALLRGLGAEDPVALALEHELQRAADVLLVVDDEDGAQSAIKTAQARDGTTVGQRMSKRGAP
jgi:hypothetical protein